MSWPFFHKVANILIIYGPDAAALYARGLERLRAWLGLAPGNPWWPLALLWAAHFLGGMLAAAAGLRVGREAAAEPCQGQVPAGPLPRPAVGAPPPLSRSATGLALHVLCLAAAMSLGQKLPIWGFAAASAAYAVLCVSTSPRAMMKLRRFSLWFSILAISALAGLVLGDIEAGLRMGLRAVFLTMSFSCIGEGLKNPRLRSWLERRCGRSFFDALEQAFATLPAVLASLPPGAQFLRSPVASLRASLDRAPEWLEALAAGRVFIITGGQGAGKSSAAAGLADALRGAGSSVGGLHAPGFWDDGQRGGFDLVDLRTGERRPFCRRDGAQGWPGVGPFRFSPEGIAFGRKALAEARRLDLDVLMVDEVGHLELRGQGWAPELDALVSERGKPMVWVVRSGLVDDVRRRWGLADARIWEAGKDRLEDIVGQIRRP